MAVPTILDLRSKPMAGKWTPKKSFHPGGSPGKLHRALGVPEGEKIPASRLQAAAHSTDRGVRNMAIRAETMSHWRKPGHGKTRREALYDHPRSRKE